MARNSNTKRVYLGNPEHVVDGQRARQLITNAILFKPNNDDKRINQSVLPIENKHVQVNDVNPEYYGNNQPTSLKAKEHAESIADNMIRHLENNGQFNKFTIESLALMSKDFLDTTKYDVSELPATNGKTFTALQSIRTAEEMGIDDYQMFANTSTYPKTWRKDTTLVNPKGLKQLTNYKIDSAFSKLQESQQDAVMRLYDNANKDLDDVLDAQDYKVRSFNAFNGYTPEGSKNGYPEIWKRQERVMDYDEARKFMSHRFDAGELSEASKIMITPDTIMEGLKSSGYDQYTIEALNGITDNLSYEITTGIKHTNNNVFDSSELITLANDQNSIDEYKDFIHPTYDKLKTNTIETKLQDKPLYEYPTHTTELSNDKFNTLSDYRINGDMRLVKEPEKVMKEYPKLAKETQIKFNKYEPAARYEEATYYEGKDKNAPNYWMRSEHLYNKDEAAKFIDNRIKAGELSDLRENAIDNYRLSGSDVIEALESSGYTKYSVEALNGLTDNTTANLIANQSSQNELLKSPVIEQEGQGFFYTEELMNYANNLSESAEQPEILAQVSDNVNQNAVNESLLPKPLESTYDRWTEMPNKYFEQISDYAVTGNKELVTDPNEFLEDYPDLNQGIDYDEYAETSNKVQESLLNMDDLDDNGLVK